MTFNFVPADCPPIWMQFVPAEEDKIATEGLIHTGMNNEIITVDSDEKQAEEEVSNVAEDISENGVSAKGVGPHIPSVDEASQLRDSRLAECEYQRDCNSVGKKQTDRLSDNFFDPLSLATTTGRGRDAVVVEMRKSAGQSGSRNDRLAPPLCGLDRMLRIHLDDDFNSRVALPIGKLSGATGCSSASVLEAVPIFHELPRQGNRLRPIGFGARHEIYPEAALADKQPVAP